MITDRTDHFVVVSGCSGGGKSTLLAELGRRGHAVVGEPGRRIVQAELAHGGAAVPWIDPAAFLRRAIDVALADRETARGSTGWVFFDRGLVDAASALQDLTGEPVLERLGRTHRYCPRVFFTPPWPEIYATDAERRHDLDAAIREYDRLAIDYPALGYEIAVLPKVGVIERAAFVERLLTHG